MLGLYGDGGVDLGGLADEDISPPPRDSASFPFPLRCFSFPIVYHNYTITTMQRHCTNNIFLLVFMLKNSVLGIFLPRVDHQLKSDSVVCSTSSCCTYSINIRVHAVHTNSANNSLSS